MNHFVINLGRSMKYSPNVFSPLNEFLPSFPYCYSSAAALVCFVVVIMSVAFVVKHITVIYRLYTCSPYCAVQQKQTRSSHAFFIITSSIRTLLVKHRMYSSL